MSSLRDKFKNTSNILPDRRYPLSKEPTNIPKNYNSSKTSTTKSENLVNYPYHDSTRNSNIYNNNQNRSRPIKRTTSSIRSSSNSQLSSSQLDITDPLNRWRSMPNNYLNNNTGIDTVLTQSLYSQSRVNNGNYATNTNLQTGGTDKYSYKTLRSSTNENFENNSLGYLDTPFCETRALKYFTDKNSFNLNSNRDIYQHPEHKYNSEINLNRFHHSQIKREDSAINGYLDLTYSNANIYKFFPESFSEWKSINGDCKYCDNSKLIQYLYSKIEKLQKKLEEAEKLKTLQSSEKKENPTSDINQDLIKPTEYISKATINESNNTTSLSSKAEQSRISRSGSVRISPSLSRPQQQSPQLTVRSETPIGFENPQGYCFLNCVVQQFYSCVEFRDKLIQYHHSDEIVKTENDMSENVFVNDFTRLMVEIKNCNSDKVREFVKKIQSFFSSSSTGDDVLTCFMNILSVVHRVTSTRQRLIRSASWHNLSADESFESFRRNNGGFVFECFYGQMSYTMNCETCGLILNKKYQIFKSIPLPVPKSTKRIPLKNLIDLFLEKTPVLSNEIKNCKCDNGVRKIYSITEITHAPRYLFIYLNRGSFFVEKEKNDTFISSDEILELPTEHGNLCYQLISVINHIGVKDGGHYYAKSCFETHIWWNLNDSSVSRIYDQQDIVTKDTIVFLFKKLMN